MTNLSSQVQALKDAVKTLYQDEKCAEMGWEMDKPTIVVALREVINQLQQSPGIISCPDILTLCEELEKM